MDWRESHKYIGYPATTKGLLSDCLMDSEVWDSDVINHRRDYRAII